MSSAVLTINVLSSTIVTAELIFAKISSGAKIVQQALTLFRNSETGGICVPKSTLSERLGMKPGTITKYLNELIKAGFLQNHQDVIVADLPIQNNKPAATPSPVQPLEETEVFEALDNKTKDVIIKALKEQPAPRKQHPQSLAAYYPYLYASQSKANAHLVYGGIMWCLNHAYNLKQPDELKDLHFLPALKALSQRIDRHANEYLDSIA